MIALDLVNTVALAGVVLFGGYALRRLIPPLARFNLPAPVIGGLLVALLVTWLRSRGESLLKLDTTLQTPLDDRVLHFRRVTVRASRCCVWAVPRSLLFLMLSTLAAIAQNVLGAGVAAAGRPASADGGPRGFGHPHRGPATGLAFAPLFEEAGVRGAATLAVAAAMVGIVSGGLIGGPIGTRLIEGLGLRPAAARPRTRPWRQTWPRASSGSRRPRAPAGEDVESYALLKALVAILVAMWAGGFVSGVFTSCKLTLPAYIGAMLVAALIRNLDDWTGWLRLSQKVIDDLGTVALSLFLVLALMSLKLWELAGLALPLTVILLAQVGFVALLSLRVVPRVMGRDYDAAVMSSGFCGFMLGTTANAMANMGALVERYGPAPRAYLAVPMVGAFFIDFTNALLITACLNLFR